MVYCGKPSKGCSTCRDRRVKCDQTRPACGQCMKRKKPCPGYRNHVDLLFRDESSHVIMRATAAPRARPQATIPSAPSASGTSTTSPASSTASGSASSADSSSVIHAATAIVAPSSALSRSNMIITLDPAGSLVASDRQPEDAEPIRCGPGTQKGPRRPKARRHARRPSHPEAVDYPAEVDESQAVAIRKEKVLSALVPLSYRERGTAFFFARYVATDHGCYQNFDFIYEIWKPPIESAEPDCVTTSITAVGLAGLAKLTRCPDTMQRACQSYGAALALTNAALSDPEKITNDSTMVAVLILGTYEFMGGRSRQTVHAWQKHVTGAATLASMRGIQQFGSRAGVRMFLMLCHSVLISCVQSDLPMPVAMVELRHKLNQLKGGTKNPAWRVVEPIYKALQIRHDIKVGTITDKEDIIQKLLDIEDEFAAVVAQLPTSWRYRHGHLAKPNPEVMGDRCHIYANLAQATTWNGMRTMRMLLHETIVEQLSADADTPADLSMHDQLRLSQAMGLLHRLGDAIVESVPQHFGIVSARDVVYDSPRVEPLYAIPARENSYRLLSAPPSPSGSNEVQDAPSPCPSQGPTLLDPTQSRVGPEWDASRFMTLATASNTIIWPLYTLGMSSCCSPDTMDYILDRLYAVHNETGLEQARSVIDLLRSKVSDPIRDKIAQWSLPQLSEGDLPFMV